MKFSHLTLILSALLILVLFIPSLPAAEEKQPRAAFKDTVYDFGAVVRGKLVTHSFSVRNTGTEKLVFQKVSLTDRALTVKFKKVIPPGGKGLITLELATEQVRGSIKAGALLYTNDPLHPTVWLYLKG